MKFPVTKNPNPGTMPPADKLGFGSVFSDHMFIMDYSGKEGWHDPRIVPFGPLSLSPAASVFHYAGEVFEGLKAYRRKDGKVQLFRHDANVERLNNSAERIGLPLVPADIAMAAIEQLVEVDQAWVPSAPGTSLYIRPFLFSTDPELSLHGVHQAMFVIILSPSGSYYAEGLNPVKIMLETEDVRAVRGGTGYTKCGGNYAASNRAGDRAMEKGYSQVLWLDGVERKYVEEVGAMNVMFKIDGKVVTPALTGSILPGITRRSCIQMLKSWGVEVEERLVSIDELVEAAQNGKLEEAWGTGTAAVISPIGELCYKDVKYTVNDFKIGPTAQKLYDELTGLQWGDKPDPFGWIKVIGE
ncbi:MAG: branched-chain amino acid aminotransferase [Clostridia bacterium]|nr:branched-chain amino acid aminotransferase [Clostridia bacterium]